MRKSALLMFLAGRPRLAGVRVRVGTWDSAVQVHAGGGASVPVTWRQSGENGSHPARRSTRQKGGA
jgi:hypothetical protein